MKKLFALLFIASALTVSAQKTKITQRGPAVLGAFKVDTAGKVLVPDSTLKDSTVTEYVISAQQYAVFQQLLNDYLSKQAQQQYESVFKGIKSTTTIVKVPAKKTAN